MSLTALPMSFQKVLLKYEGWMEQLKFEDFPPVIYMRLEHFSSVDIGYTWNGFGSFCSEDHPSFKKLRNELSDRGYIQKQENWLNGDVVIKPFYLNRIYFDTGDSFYCSSALYHKMKNYGYYVYNHYDKFDDEDKEQEFVSCQYTIDMFEEYDYG